MNSIAPEQIYLERDAKIPNNPKLPVLLYREILSPDLQDKASAFEHRFNRNGWRGAWRDTIYDYQHYHSNAHEALAIARGDVIVQIGGASGKQIKLRAGDLIVLPAGTGHRRVDASEDLMVVGAYPKGQEDYDMIRSGQRRVNAELPRTDPFYGSTGPLPALWGLLQDAGTNRAAPRRKRRHKPAKGTTMLRGSKETYTDNQKRQAEHIEEGYEKRGTGKKEAERRAWATVNKMTGGGKKSGSGKGKKVNKAPARKGGKKGGAAKIRASRK